MKEQRKIELQHQSEIDIQTFENELHDIEHQIQQLQSRKKEIEENLLPQAKRAQKKFEKIDESLKLLHEMCCDVFAFCKNEYEMNQELFEL